MKYKAKENWKGLKEFESDKPIFEKMVELGYLTKIEPIKRRKKKVIDNAPKNK